MNRGTFKRGGNKLIRCSCCLKLTHSQIGCELCAVCYDSASNANDHDDTGHAETMASCPSCQRVACLHQRAA
jgi:hypothetical protein